MVKEWPHIFHLYETPCMRYSTGKGRVQMKPGYQELEGNQESEYFLYQEPEQKKEDLDFKNQNRNQN